MSESGRVPSPKRDDETQTGYALRLVSEQARWDTLAEVAAFLDFEGIRRGYTADALAIDLASFDVVRDD